MRLEILSLFFTVKRIFETFKKFFKKLLTICTSINIITITIIIIDFRRNDNAEKQPPA